MIVAHKRALCSLTARALAVACLCVASVAQVPMAHASDEAYGPRRYARKELIDFGTFPKSPLQLKAGWRELSTRTVTHYERTDFEHTLDVPFDTFMEEMRRAYKASSDVIELSREAFPASQFRALRIIGMQDGGRSSQMTIGLAALPQHFIMEARAEGRHTVVTFHNASYTMVYSGVVPARAEFAPAQARPVRLLWN